MKARQDGKLRELLSPAPRAHVLVNWRIISAPQQTTITWITRREGTVIDLISMMFGSVLLLFCGGAAWLDVMRRRTEWLNKGNNNHFEVAETCTCAYVRLCSAFPAQVLFPHSPKGLDNVVGRLIRCRSVVCDYSPEKERRRQK